MPAPKGNKNAVGNKGGGRKSYYQKRYALMAEHIASFAKTDAEIAKVFGVCETTINAWKKKHVEFSKALKKGKAKPDDEVERSLFERAMGYSHPEEKIFCNNGKIVRTTTTKHYAPDTTACIFWLKNRRPDEWRDRKELAGDPDNPIAVIGKEWALSQQEDPD